MSIVKYYVIPTLSLIVLILLIINGILLAISYTTQQFESLIVASVEPVRSPRLSELPVETQIRKIFRSDARIALAVFKAESGLRCDSVSPTNDHGVAQLHGKPIYDCTENLLEAKRMFDRRGWQPWVAYNSGAYKKYLQ